MGARFNRKADHLAGSDGQYIRAIADFRVTAPVRPSEADRLRAGGRRASDRAGRDSGEKPRNMNRHLTAMGFAWAAVAAAWFGGMALIALLRSLGVL